MPATAYPQGDPGDETDAHDPSDDEKTLSWVEQQFRELGFNELQAVALAEAGADWHEAQRLLKSGCPFLTAVDLLT